MWISLALAILTPTATAETVDLGEPRYSRSVVTGVSLEDFGESVGAMVRGRIKRTTNITFLDLQVEGFVGPDRNGDVSYLGRTRLKRSNRSFDFPHMYDWSSYELKSSSAEEVDLRAILASGFGAFLWKSSAQLINVEAGFVVDYANMEAYADQVSSGYVRAALEWDLDLSPLTAHVLNYLYTQVTETDQEEAPDQSRYELDVALGGYLTEGLEVSAGAILTRYLQVDEQRHDQPTQVVTVYAGIKYEF